MSRTRLAVHAVVDLLLVFLGTLLLIAPALVVVMIRDPRGMRYGPPPAGLVSVLLVIQVLVILAVGQYRLRQARKGKRPGLALIGAPLRPVLGLSLCVGLGAIAFGAFTVVVVRAVFGDKALMGHSVEQMLRSAQGWQLALLSLVVIVLGPVAEELFFRGAMFGAFAGAGFPRFGMGFTAALFAMAHLFPPMFPHYLGVGLALAWLYRRTGTILAPIVAHMTLNGLGMAAFLLARHFKAV